jgi:hypothetical protein
LGEAYRVVAEAGFRGLAFRRGGTGTTVALPERFRP